MWTPATRDNVATVLQWHKPSGRSATNQWKTEAQEQFRGYVYRSTATAPAHTGGPAGIPSPMRTRPIPQNEAGIGRAPAPPPAPTRPMEPPPRATTVAPSPPPTQTAPPPAVVPSGFGGDTPGSKGGVKRTRGGATTQRPAGETQRGGGWAYKACNGKTFVGFGDDVEVRGGGGREILVEKGTRNPVNFRRPFRNHQEWPVDKMNAATIARVDPDGVMEGGYPLPLPSEVANRGKGRYFATTTHFYPRPQPRQAPDPVPIRIHAGEPSVRGGNLATLEDTRVVSGWQDPSAQEGGGRRAETAVQTPNGPLSAADLEDNREAWRSSPYSTLYNPQTYKSSESSAIRRGNGNGKHSSGV
uniref:Uncharacterized protein n=1 Tax=Chromera velia CCMP2878 TaxID=1169474 RepID=A0A0G4FY30_9ALVE|eukprot:Cvel_19250.t1-p1 / transcript=Cvel_19250.t1 / gene=Cvel_19250 / organism=Chromera_velia_CCMP2878 / gene_product=hypothetical protein / transcript_product=hypothetical protein / location=Cvel_scaffold1647:28565-33797(+) / protein_length=356 / sequence_SO=supercontig / SO=protein_coding / is_pseudo=false